MSNLLSIESVFSASGFAVVPLPNFGFEITKGTKTYVVPGDGCYSHFRLRQFVAEKLNIPVNLVALPRTQSSVGTISKKFQLEPSLKNDFECIVKLESGDLCVERELPWGGVFTLDPDDSYDEEGFVTMSGYYEFEIPKKDRNDFQLKNEDVLFHPSELDRKVIAHAKVDGVIPSLMNSTLKKVELVFPEAVEEGPKASPSAAVPQKTSFVASSQSPDKKVAAGELLLDRILNNEIPILSLKASMGHAKLGVLIKNAPKSKGRILDELKAYVEEPKLITDVFEWISQHNSKALKAYLVQNINTHLALNLETQTVGLKQDDDF